MKKLSLVNLVSCYNSSIRFKVIRSKYQGWGLAVWPLILAARAEEGLLLRADLVHLRLGFEVV